MNSRLTKNWENSYAITKVFEIIIIREKKKDKRRETKIDVEKQTRKKIFA